jgi:AAA+ superfamily predicted ATPase
MGDLELLKKTLGAEYDESKILYLKQKEEPDTIEVDTVDAPIDTEGFDIKESVWGVMGNGNIYTSNPNTADKIAPGAYVATYNMQVGHHLRKVNVKTDDLIILPDDSSEKMLTHIKEFWELKEKFDTFGYLHKRGILLFGPPGSGKTSTIVQTVSQIVSMGGVAIYTDYPPEALVNLRTLRDIEPERHVVVIIEDVDEVIMRYGDKSLTAMLDGEHNMDNILFIATTNYPERLPPRIIKRPSRFDIVQYIGMPGPAARKEYLKRRLETNITPSELSIWTEKTEGLSIAHLKELIILHFVYGKELDEAINRMQKGIHIPNSNTFTREIDAEISKRDE